MSLKRGDTVKIIKGKNRGKTGKILHIDKIKNTAIVEGINLYKKHRRAKRRGEKGEVVTVPRPLHMPNIMFLCSRCGKPTRLGSKIEGDIKTRQCKKCGVTIE